MDGSATVVVSCAVLAESLHMPATTRIVAAEVDFMGEVIRLRVTSPDLPGDLDTVTPTVTRESVRWDWNLPTAEDAPA